MLNNSVNGHNKKAPRYAEIFKLAAELVKRDIPFQLDYITVGDLKKVYIRYKVGNANATFLERYMNAAFVEQGTGTKGFEDGLLQIDGLLYPEEEEKSEDGTLGWLTAGNVLERILKKEAEKNG